MAKELTILRADRGAPLTPQPMHDSVSLDDLGYVIKVAQHHGSGGYVASYDGVRATGPTPDAALGALVREGAFGTFTIESA